MRKTTLNSFLQYFTIKKQFMQYNSKSPLADFSKCDHKHSLTFGQTFAPTFAFRSWQKESTLYEVFVDVLPNQTQEYVENVE